MNEIKKLTHIQITGIALVCGIIFITLLTFMLSSSDSEAGLILLDYRNDPPPDYWFPYPFTIQNFMHLLFFIGLGEIYCRWRDASRELAMIQEKLLPEDYQTILQAHDLTEIRQKVAGRYDQQNGFLAQLIDVCILQFQAGRSVDQAVSVLNSSLELIEHRVDLRYAILRYITWLIPTVGFIGTVVGISLALSYVGLNPDNPPLDIITSALAVSFYTTLVALVLSAILILLMNIVQVKEELAVNGAGHYTLVNLINRLYSGPS